MVYYGLIRCACGKDSLPNQLVCNLDDLLHLIQFEDPFAVYFLILAIVSSVYSLPKSVRFYFQNFTYITGHVIIFLFKTEFVQNGIWVLR